MICQPFPLLCLPWPLLSMYSMYNTKIGVLAQLKDAQA